jgi:protein KRI1
MLARMKKELGGKVDWTEVEKVLDGEWDEDEWERIVGGMFGQLGDNEVRQTTLLSVKMS